MKRSITWTFAIFLLITSFVIVYGNAVIVEFHGTAGKNKVTLNWATLSEVNCKTFEIERSLNNTNFKKIGSVRAAGNSTTRKEYAFEDRNIFKTTSLSRTFYYRLKVIDTDGSFRLHSDVISITPSISGAKYTWGSIKALFR
ncbi:hypothetical protein B6D60_00360 [candidate division KSB1 bacterium 4484_87]|nr:MAG: hypothetical protein B6D60_00360 [candidate division KSB1 bacterium 4484_87]